MKALFQQFCTISISQSFYVWKLEVFSYRTFFLQVGHHEGEMPVENLDVNATGELVASIGKFLLWFFISITVLE